MLLRRDLQRGWTASVHDHFTLPRIEAWHCPFPPAAPHPTAVHLLTGANDWRLAAWMLASWFAASQGRWHVVIHDDGTLPAPAAETLQRLFGTVRIIPRAEADAAMENALRPFPHCRAYRDRHPLALKIFDVPVFASGHRFIMFDSDLLFFREAPEIIRWVTTENEECWFNEDVQEGALITAAEAREKLGVEIWPRVNSGLGLIHRPAIDFAFLERALAATSILRGHIWRVEQTLYMLCAARSGRGGLLPARYEVSLGRDAAAGAVCRHYVGAVRHRFFGEGLHRLREPLLSR